MPLFCATCKTLLNRKTGRCPTCSGEERVKIQPLRVPKGPRAVQEERPRVPTKVSVAKPLAVQATGSYFPFGAPRDGQREFLADVAQAIRQGKHLVAHAPTGLGKTVSSLAPAVEFAVAEGKRVFFLTSKQSQHRIAVETLKAVRTSSGQPLVVLDLISKQDMCARPEAKDLFAKRFAQFCRREQLGKSCEYWESENTQAVALLKKEIRHVEEAVSLCKRLVVCPHQASLDAAQTAHVVVCDYNWFFSDMGDTMLERLKVELDKVVLVVDEAHNLPDRIRDHLAHELNDYVLSDAKDDLRDLGDDALAAAVDKLQDRFLEIGETLEAGERGRPEKAVTREEGYELLQEALAGGRRSLVAWDLASFEAELANAAVKYEKQEKTEARGLAQLLEFLRVWRMERRGTVRILTRDPFPSLQYKMLDAAILARPVFDRVHASVAMSGTLHPPAAVRDVLGLDPARTVLRSYASPFPPENRLVLVDDQVTTSYAERSDATWVRIAERLAAVADATPGAVAAFFPSYATLEEVRRHLPRFLDKTLVVEEREASKDQKEALVQRIRDGEEALLVAVQGGSLSEGYDYEGNMLKGVVVVGMPYAAPSIEVDALVAYMTQRFGPGVGREYAYVKPMLDRVLQAAGRLIRSPTDRGVVVFMDKRFAYRNLAKLWPPDVYPRVAEDPSDEVRRFWAARRP